MAKKITDEKLDELITASMKYVKIIDQWTGAELHPGSPTTCQGNGENQNFEICCDNCDCFGLCFPEWNYPNGEAWKKMYNNE